MKIFPELIKGLDFLESRPKRVEDVEICPIEENGFTRYVLKHRSKKTYIKITALEYFLWERMDGSRTVRELFAAYFEEFNVLPGTRVAQFIVRLRDKWFLQDSDIPVFIMLRAVLAARTFSARATRFFLKEFIFPKVDAPIGWLYRRGAGLAFTKGGVVFLALLSLAGLYCFGRAFASGDFSVWRLGGSVAFAVLYYIFLFSVITAIHELAHALAVKHFRREVISVGVGIYGYLIISPYVNTTDIHAQPSRGAKAVVSLAGPATHWIVGGFAGVCTVFLPFEWARQLMFMLALFSYVFFFFITLYPGHSSDWYHLVSDYWLIPSLSVRASSFVRKELRAKLRAKEPLSILEKVLTAYYMWLCGWWIAFASVAAYLIYHQRWLPGYLWREGGWLGRVLVLATGGAVALGLSFLVFVFGRYALLRLQRSKLLESPDRILWFALCSFTVLLLGPPAAAILADRGEWTLVCPTALLGVVGATTLWLCLGSRRDPFRHPWRGMQVLLGGGTALVLVGALLVVLRAQTPRPVLEAAFLCFVGVTAIWLFAAGCVAYFLNGFEICARKEQLSAIILTASAIVLVVPPLTYWNVRPGTSRIAALVSPSAASLLILALFLFVPTTLTFRKSLSARTWQFVIGAALSLAVVIVAGPLFASLSPLMSSLVLLLLLGNCANMLALAEFSQVLTSHGARFKHPAAAGDVLRRDSDHLRNAVRILMTQILDNVRVFFGERRAASLADDFNRESILRGLGLTIGLAGINDGIPSSADLREVVTSHGTALRIMIERVSQLGGTRFSEEMFSYLFAFLNWREREVLGSYVLTGKDWSRLATFAEGRLSATPSQLLESIPFFDCLSPEQITHLQSLFKIVDYPAAEVLFRQGEPAEDFYIVLDGRVEIFSGNNTEQNGVIAACGPGDYFGEIALFEDIPRTAGARTSGRTRLASLAGKDFKDYLVPHLPADARGVWNLVRQLRSLPMFRGFDWPSLMDTARKFEKENVPGGFVVIRQGEVGDKFYVIESGRVEVSVEQVQEDGRRSARKMLAQLGPGEYFGEIALLYDVPRTATVTALSDCALFALPRPAFHQLHADIFRLDSPARQIASRRLADIALATGPRGSDLELILEKET